jgi:DNA-binding CsgD family transcriptional regulator
VGKTVTPVDLNICGEVRFDEFVESVAKRLALGPREHLVLLDFVNGKSLKEIANGRECSVKTIETHMHRVLVKAGLSSQKDLLTYLLRYFLEVFQGPGGQPTDAEGAAFTRSVRDPLPVGLMQAVQIDASSGKS